MAISEQTVFDSLSLAAEEINADGGVLGKQIEVVSEDGASEPTIFAEKAQKLISSDCVAATFGGWTSASRKAMLPSREQRRLLFYPVQYEGLESSENIFYSGATTNQQIVPALDYLRDARDSRGGPCSMFHDGKGSGEARPPGIGRTGGTPLRDLCVRSQRGSAGNAA
ncbi:transporter substrate-binding protein [Georgenia sp. SUBG003]|uniref:transporter substrate-binding protein n=1 Tax=Georgenia sp. SUBG003 TaxID=1497974 RepID=UPI003AB58179